MNLPIGGTVPWPFLGGLRLDTQPIIGATPAGLI
jgi:hypothetical protein